MITIHALVDGFQDRWTFHDPAEAEAYFSHMKREHVSPVTGEHVVAAVLIDENGETVEGFIG